MRLVFGRGLAVDHCGSKGGALAEIDRADFQPVLFLNDLPRALMRFALCRYGIENDIGRRITGKAQQIAEIIEGIKVKRGRAHRNQGQICVFGSSGGGAFDLAGGVDNDQFSAALAKSIQGLGHVVGVAPGNSRSVISAPLGPYPGAGLRIQIKKSKAYAVLYRPYS